MDIIDKASELEEIQRASAIATRVPIVVTKRDLRRRVACRDCGERITPARLVAVSGTERCLECQEIFELRRRGAL